jgi:Ca-activated chloride channel family protein
MKTQSTLERLISAKLTDCRVCIFPLLTVLSLFFMALTASPQQPLQQGSNSANQYEIRSEVALVVLHMTVRDRNGGLVSGLAKENFQVSEDGSRQEIEFFGHEDLPATIGLVVDNSGSMQSKRLEVNTAALDFARSSNSQDQWFVVNFNERVSFGLPQNLRFTSEVEQLQFALSRTVPAGMTALYDAISNSLDHLRKGDRDKKALIIISDGGDNASKAKLDDVLEKAIRSDAIIFTIGIFGQDDTDRNPRVLQRLAKATGGEAFLPESLDDVLPICRRIAVDIRNQYSATYTSSNQKKDGTYRSIKVRANGPGHGRLFVRARGGYYAPSSAPVSPPAGETRHDGAN